MLLTAAALCLVSPSLASAQSSTDVRDKIQRSGHSEQEVRDRLEESGMTPAQIRAALKEAGYDPDALNEYLPGGKRGPGASYADDSTGTVEAQPPSDALTAPLAPPAFVEPAPHAKIRPEDWPEFTKEVAKRTHIDDPVLPFGYEVFGYLPATFEPLSAGPVDPDYPIGPGDEVIVQVWGDNQFTHAAVVNREATISVPDIGQVVLNGLTLGQAKRLITDRLGAVYSGIRARRATTFVDVTLGKLRTIQVFILGDVVRPGGYTISSVATVLNALYNAGGPTPRGSMRDIRIIRHNQVYQHADLYGYILTGSKAEDVRLQSGDVVFVPPIGKQAAVVGEVHRPAIYELAPGEGLQELLRLCGGVLTTAVIDHALIDRVVPFAERDSLAGQDRVVVDVPLRSVLADAAKDAEVHDRDILQIYRIGDTRKNTVEITGKSVIHPGLFQWRPGMHVAELLKDAGGLDPDAYMDRAQIFRTNRDGTRTMRSFNLNKALANQGDDNLALQEMDSIAVTSVWDIRDRHTVAISGNVRKPGTYEYLDGMTVMDLIFRAGGLTESAYKLRAEVSRVDSTTIATTKAAEVHQVAITGDYAVHSADSTFALKQNDQIFVREVPDWDLQRNVTIAGEVAYPGTYSLQRPDERLSSLITRAGGFKPSAYPRAATFTRRQGNAGRLSVDVERAAKGKRPSDVMLEEGDQIFIPKQPRTVKVAGEVGFPASVLYEGGKSLGYYIEQAGGYTDNSDKGRVKVIQPNGKVKSVRSTWWDPKPDPGALVIVPKKGPAEKKETLKDIATIVGIVSGAATTIFLAHQATK
ncbi:MAG TPA: SLBB domain-containing protein [Candidatus Binatia bacterium]|nr:SLBB domain-containing protein [Candidatus Binatia bacterium]